ncbi:MAG: hypothetical protein R3185_00960, partial [Candidatus Thermoplasmatota archaeon]|nr:hypothetical protein [Candidatus Thermoplasmatota archaeon]
MRPQSRLIAITLVALVALTGCLGTDEPELQEDAQAPMEPEAQRGEPRLQRGPIETHQDDDGWVAVQGINITNGLGATTEATIRLSAPAGGISLDHDEDRPAGDLAPGTGYWIQITLRAKGDTEEQARRGVQSMRLAHTDELAGERLTLATEVTYREQDPANLTDVDPEGLLGAGADNRHARIRAHVPPGPHYEARAETSTGGVSIAGAFPTAEARTTTGGVSLVLFPWTSGTVVAETGSGGVSVVLQGGADNGYDVTADT